MIAFDRTTAAALAREIVTARETRTTIVPPTERFERFSLDDGYAVGAEVLARYRMAGRTPAGLKVGFTNTAVWTDLGLNQPMWAPMYRETITTDATLTVADYLTPRIEPEVAIFVERGEIAGWALAFEIVDAHFPGWKFAPADAMADAGLHCKLVLGERRPLDLASGDPFGNRTVALHCNGAIVERGRCSDVIGGPLRVWTWLRERFTPSDDLRWDGVEVVTTGSLTSVPYLKAGERWDFTIDGYLGGSPVLEVL